MGKRNRSRRLNQKSLGWVGPLAPVNQDTVTRLMDKVLIGFWAEEGSSPDKVTSPKKRLQQLEEEDNLPTLVVQITKMAPDEYERPKAHWKPVYVTASEKDHAKFLASGKFTPSSGIWTRQGLFMRGRLVRQLLKEKKIVEYAAK